MTLLATETFTAADGTLITARTCDTGQSWAKHPSSDASNLVINTGHAELSGLSTTGFSRYLLGVSLGNGDYTFTGTFNTPGSGNSYYGVVFLRADATAATSYEYRKDGGTNQWAITREVGGVETTLATTATVVNPAGGPTIVTAGVSGAGATVALSLRIQIAGFGVDETITFNDTDATRIVATGSPGIGLAEFVTTPLTSWDTLEIDGTAGGAVALPTLFHRYQSFPRRRR